MQFKYKSLYFVITFIFILIILFLVRMQQINWNKDKIFSFDYVPCVRDYELYNDAITKSSKKTAYVTMSTIPCRLIDDWFYTNMVRTLSLPGNFVIIVNIPYISLKNIPYVIPKRVRDLERTGKFIIHRCHDEGPITKLLPTLRNSMIPDDSHIISIDDDIVYKSNIFVVLNAGIHKYPENIVSMCSANSNNVAGYRGYGFVKKTLKGLINVNIPKSCMRIDDDVISSYIQYKKISIIILPYNKHTDSFCSGHRDLTDTHPAWDELLFDNRPPMQKQCSKEINFCNT